MKVLHVCTAFDRTFFTPATVMMHSVAKNTNCRIHFHLLVPKDDSEDYEDYSRKFSLFQNCLVSIYKVDNEILSKTLSMKGVRHFSDAAIYRLLMTDYLPRSIDRILYLDGDLIVNLDISEIFMKHWNNTFAARIEKVDDGYFNSGVFLTSLNYWRDYDVKSRALDYLLQNPSLEYKDQDSLNHIFKTSNSPLEKRFNFPLADFRNDISRKCIFHFTGTIKPWKQHAPGVFPVKLWRSVYSEIHGAKAPLQKVKWSLFKKIVITSKMMMKI